MVPTEEFRTLGGSMKAAAEAESKGNSAGYLARKKQVLDLEMPEGWDKELLQAGVNEQSEEVTRRRQSTPSKRLWRWPERGCRLWMPGSLT